jgi:hypothetical protein
MSTGTKLNFSADVIIATRNCQNSVLLANSLKKTHKYIYQINRKHQKNIIISG